MGLTKHIQSCYPIYKMRKKFNTLGFTKDPAEAGLILTTGKGVDFSGNTSGHRQHAHHDVAKLLKISYHDMFNGGTVGLSTLGRSVVLTFKDFKQEFTVAQSLFLEGVYRKFGKRDTYIINNCTGKKITIKNATHETVVDRIWKKCKP